MLRLIIHSCLKQRSTLCLALMLLLVGWQPALAEKNSEEAAKVAQAESNAPYSGSASLKGLRANTLGVGAARATNFSVTAHGICRYVDVIGDKNVFLPFNTMAEWGKFIANVNKNDVALDFCRLQHDFGAVDFGPALSFNDPSYNAAIPAPSAISKFYTVPANMKGQLQAGVGTVYTVDPAPLKRVDTRSVAALKGFRDMPENRSHEFTVYRQDCRHTTYPDGSTAEICNPQSWVETITAIFRYTLNANGIVGNDTESSVIAKLSPLRANPEMSEVGSWSGQLLRTATIPPFEAVPNRSCAGRTHGEKYWEDANWQEVEADCGTGYKSDPTDPYKRRWQNEREYQCFDEGKFDGSYPTPTLREKAGTSQYIGKCLPIIAGQCNAEYTSKSYQTLNNSPVLCTAGDVAGFQFLGDKWTYKCLGQNAADASCTVPKVASGNTFWVTGMDGAVDGLTTTGGYQILQDNPLLFDSSVMPNTTYYTQGFTSKAGPACPGFVQTTTYTQVGTVHIGTVTQSYSYTDNRVAPVWEFATGSTNGYGAYMEHYVHTFAVPAADAVCTARAHVAHYCGQFAGIGSGYDKFITTDVSCTRGGASLAPRGRCGPQQAVLPSQNLTASQLCVGATASAPVKNGTATNGTWNWTCTDADNYVKSCAVDYAPAPPPPPESENCKSGGNKQCTL